MHDERMQQVALKGKPGIYLLPTCYSPGGKGGKGVKGGSAKAAADEGDDAAQDFSLEPYQQ